jgi:hypothetical protein
MHRNARGKRLPVKLQRPEVRLADWVTKLKSGWRPHPGQRPRALIRDLEAAIEEINALGEAGMTQLAADLKACGIDEQGNLTKPQDPIASAVRAELQPLEDALIDAGHKLAKDGEVEGLMGDVRRAEAEYEAVRRRYDELLYAVARKYPGESRHETALRYIRERESQPAHGPVAAKKEGA